MVMLFIFTSVWKTPLSEKWVSRGDVYHFIKYFDPGFRFLANKINYCMHFLGSHLCQVTCFSLICVNLVLFSFGRFLFPLLHKSELAGSEVNSSGFRSKLHVIKTDAG